MLHLGPKRLLSPLISISAFLTATTASAQVEREMETLLRKGVSIAQTLAIGLCSIALIRAGLAFTDEEKSQTAWGRLKMTLLGCAIVFGAVGITQFVKAQFTAQPY